jgi:hypothetical protein
MAFWRSVGDQGKCLRNDTTIRAFTVSQNSLVYVQNFGASFVSCMRRWHFIDHKLLLDWDNIAIRGVPGAGPQRSYVVFVVLR